MILSDADAIAHGWPNLASYKHAMRMQAARDAEHDAARAQAEHMVSRRNQQSGVGTIIRAVPAPNLGAE